MLFLACGVFLFPRFFLIGCLCGGLGFIKPTLLTSEPLGFTNQACCYERHLQVPNIFLRQTSGFFQAFSFHQRERISLFVHLGETPPIPIPSGIRLHNYGKSPFITGKSSISMVHFQCLPGRVD